MILTIKIPDDDRKLRIFKGWELIAFSDGDELVEKVESCNKCGLCCHDNPGTVYGNDEEGRCKALVRHGDEWECSVGVEVPWYCMDDPNWIPSCSIRHTRRRIK